MSVFNHLKFTHFSTPDSKKKLDFRDTEAPDYEAEMDPYTYESPTQKEVKEIKILLEIKRAEIKATKLKVEKMEKDYVLPFQNDETVGGRCGICHVRGHQKPSCQNPPCVTLKQCGHMKGHPDEKKAFDGEKTELKKLLREEKVLEDKIEKQEAAEKAVMSSFPQAVRNTLINSNKSKYLIATPEGYVPRTCTIIRDIGTLQKVFKNEVPKNLSTMGPTFRMIIEENDRKYNVRTHRDPILNLLQEKGIKLPHRVSTSQSSRDQEDLEWDMKLALRKSLYDQSSRDLTGSDIFSEILQELKEQKRRPHGLNVADSKDITPEKSSKFRSRGYDQSPSSNVLTPTKSPVHKRPKSVCNSAVVNSLQQVQEAFSQMASPSKGMKDAKGPSSNQASFSKSAFMSGYGLPDSTSVDPYFYDPWRQQQISQNSYPTRGLSGTHRAESYTARSLSSAANYTPQSLLSAEAFTSQSMSSAETFTPRSRLSAETYTPRSRPSAEIYNPRSLSATETYTPRSLSSANTYTPRSLSAAETFTPRSLSAAETYTPRSLSAAETYFPRSQSAADNYTPRSMSSAETYPISYGPLPYDLSIYSMGSPTLPPPGAGSQTPERQRKTSSKDSISFKPYQ